MAIRAIQSGTGRVRSPGLPIGSTGGGGGAPSVNSSLLLHFDVSGPLIDSSSYAHTINSVAVALSNPGKFTKGLDASSISAWGALTAGLVTSNKWSMDFWIKPKVWPGFSAQTIYIGDNSRYFRLSVDGVNKRIIVRIMDASLNSVLATTASDSLVLDTQTHVAITRNLDVVSIFLDGTLAATSAALPESTVPSDGTSFAIDPGSYTEFDEFRYVHDSVLWDGTFTPPSSPYTS